MSGGRLRTGRSGRSSCAGVGPRHGHGDDEGGLEEREPRDTTEIDDVPNHLWREECHTTSRKDTQAGDR